MRAGNETAAYAKRPLACSHSSHLPEIYKTTCRICTLYHCVYQRSCILLGFLSCTITNWSTSPLYSNCVCTTQVFTSSQTNSVLFYTTLNWLGIAFSCKADAHHSCRFYASILYIVISRKYNCWSWSLLNTMNEGMVLNWLGLCGENNYTNIQQNITLTS